MNPVTPITLYPEQEGTVTDAVAFLLDDANPKTRQGYVGPTGSGKSIVAVTVKHRIEDLNRTLFIVAPTDEILKGFASKDDRIDQAKLAKLTQNKRKLFLESLGYYTPIRLRNALLRGDVAKPNYVIKDEVHHDESNTYELIDALLGDTRQIGLTATFFRGTAKSTAAFREKWGEPKFIITLPESVKHGRTAFPQCSIVPLLDDDVIEVVNGEFVVKQLETQVIDMTERVVALVRQHCVILPDTDAVTYAPSRPTMLALPTVYTAKLYTQALRGAGIEADIVVGDTKDKDRDAAYARCVARDSVLVQVHVVGEGVDLPIRCLIDLSPMMSPVQWYQQFGRVTRPTPKGEDPPTYICTNRNLLRHAYLLDGLLPPEIYSKGEVDLGGPSKRKPYRIFGFESLGKFSTIDIPLHNDTTGTMVIIQRLEGNVVTEYAAIASPLHQDVLYATRTSVRQQTDGKTAYGEWSQIESIPDLSNGFTSVRSGELTPSMAYQWKTYGRWYGLNNDAIVTRKQYPALPILRNTRHRFR